MKHSSPRSRAFTLVETLVAILLILALSGAVVSFVWNVIASRDRATESARRADEWARLVSLVQGAVLTSCAQGADGVFGGTAGTLRIPSRVLYLTPNAVSGGGNTLALSFQRGSREITVSRGRDSEVAVRGVSDVSIRFWTGRAWSDSFDAAAAGTLPAAIEVALWLDDAPDEAESDEPASTPRRSPDRWRIFAVPDGREDPSAGGVS